MTTTITLRRTITSINKLNVDNHHLFVTTIGEWENLKMS